MGLKDVDNIRNHLNQARNSISGEVQLCLTGKQPKALTGNVSNLAIFRIIPLVSLRWSAAQSVRLVSADVQGLPGLRRIRPSQ